MSPFGIAPGTRQGRIQPVTAAPFAGSFVFALGLDANPTVEQDLAYGDQVTVDQALDVTGIDYIRASVRFRNGALPSSQVLPAGATLNHGGFLTTPQLRSRLVIGAGASQVQYHSQYLGDPATFVPPTTQARVLHDTIGPNAALVVEVIDRDIRVHLATDGAGAATSRPHDVARAVNANPAALALVRASAIGNGTATTAAIAALALPVNDDLDFVRTLTDFWTAAHVGRVLRIAGAANPANNADRHVIALLDARNALVSSALITEAAGAFTATLLGARWDLAMQVDGTTRSSRRELPSRAHTYTLDAHVSKLAGVHTLRFRAQLVEA